MPLSAWSPYPCTAVLLQGQPHAAGASPRPTYEPPLTWPLRPPQLMKRMWLDSGLQAALWGKRDPERVPPNLPAPATLRSPSSRMPAVPHHSYCSFYPSLPPQMRVHIHALVPGSFPTLALRSDLTFSCFDCPRPHPPCVLCAHVARLSSRCWKPLSAAQSGQVP